jgi:hypothetical protein
MKCKVMVNVVIINLVMNTWLAKVEIVGGRPKRIKIMFLVMKPTSPTFLFSPLFCKI